MAALSEKQLALLLAQIRETMPEQARRLEDHFESSAAEADFMGLFERIILAATESSTVGQNVVGRMEANTQALAHLERMMERWALAREESNNIEQKRLGLESDIQEHSQKMDLVKLEHERHLAEQEQHHRMEVDTMSRKQWFKIIGGALGGLVSGGGLAQLVDIIK